MVEPTAPRPITPSVRPGSSMPANCYLPASVALCISSSVPDRPSTNFSAGTRLRAPSSMPAITSSFTALALAPGALNTGTPRSDSFFTGMLLVPAPARAIARTDTGMSISCRLAERTRMPSGSVTSPPTVLASGSRASPRAEMALSVRILRGSAMAFLEFAHAVDQRTHAFDRHGVVDRRAHAADRAVAFQLDQAAFLGSLEEGLVERGVLERERHVHQRAVVFRHRRVVHRIVVGVDLVGEHGRGPLQGFPDQVVAHDDDGQPGRADVLLRAGVDHAELRYVDRTRQDGR